MSGAPRRLALITGGAQRVGRAVCLALARAGYDVILTRLTSRDEAEQTAGDCRALGVSASVESLDLNDLPGVEAFAARFAQSHERLDVLVHNASLYERTIWGEIDAQHAEAHLRINALAPLLLTQGLEAPLQRAGGLVVAMCDAQTLGRARKRYAAYSMSKAAIAEMVGTLAREMAPKVRVVGIAPGVVAWPPDASPEEIESYEARIPLERSGTPEDVAELIVYLAQRSTYITGEIIRLDGGRSLT
ncbi:MAG: SDR family oxidoreductase [Phycisphaerales bacterium]|nr:SDR family oxidoreductase [Phycisphaerales bacterium]